VLKHSFGRWLFLLIDGQALLNDEEYNPNDPSGYLSRLYENVPSISPTARQYINEAVQTYYYRTCMAANVILGDGAVEGWSLISVIH